MTPVPLRVSQIILGKYEVTRHLQGTHLYQWVEALHIETKKQYTIQFLSNGILKEQLKDVFDYFDALKNIRRKGIIIPDQIVSNNELSIGIIHAELLETSFLNLSKVSDLDLILTHLFEASELLHILNNKNLIHGKINPNSFILKNNKIALSDFGYAPFLLQGNVEAIKDCGDFLPPEINDASSAQQSRQTIDTYAFAKTVAYWLPDVCESVWYLKATNSDPNQRFKRMRNLYEALKQTLQDLFLNREIVDSLPAPENPEPETKLDPQSHIGIVPKYIIDVHIDPPEAGRVEGAGKHTEGKQLKLEAISFPDWEFIGWEGDIIETSKSLDLIIDKNLAIIAKYRKLPKAFVSIHIDVFPAEAKDLVKISGMGNHTIGTIISVHAWSISPTKYRFSGWEGDINSSANPLTLSVESDLKITARFLVISELGQNKSSSTRQLGGAFSKNLTHNDPIDNLLFEQKIDKETKILDDINKSRLSQMEVINSESKRNLGSAFTLNQKEESSDNDLISEIEQKPRKPLGSAFE